MDIENVKVKISCCGTCDGIIRAAIVHEMSTKSKNDFMKEVMKYNLSVKEISLIEYRKGTNWCKCIG